MVKAGQASLSRAVYAQGASKPALIVSGREERSRTHHRLVNHRKSIPLIQYTSDLLQSFDLLKAMRDPGIHVEMLIRCVPSGFGSVAFTSRLGGGSTTRSENQSSVRHR